MTNDRSQISSEELIILLALQSDLYTKDALDEYKSIAESRGISETNIGNCRLHFFQGRLIYTICRDCDTELQLSEGEIVEGKFVCPCCMSNLAIKFSTLRSQPVVEEDSRLNRNFEAWEHEKSESTIFLDKLRNLLIWVTTGIILVLTWEWSRIITLLIALPVYFLSLNLIGFLTLPLYAFTPENKLKAKIFKAFEDGNFEGGKALTDEYTRRFRVKVPVEIRNPK